MHEATRKPGTAKAQPANPRATRLGKRELVLDKAAELIARKGFDGTALRDIAAAVDMLPGSLYDHFASKEDLLPDIHERVVNSMTDHVKAAIAEVTDPWHRIDCAAVAHLQALLGGGSLVTIVSPNFPKNQDALDNRLAA